MIANPRHPAIAAPMNMHVNGISRIN